MKRHRASFGGVERDSQSTEAMGRRKRAIPEPITEEMDPEYTIRGSCHWVGVMQDWGWEGSLDPFLSESLWFCGFVASFFLDSNFSNFE